VGAANEEEISVLHAGHNNAPVFLFNIGVFVLLHVGQGTANAVEAF